MAKQTRRVVTVRGNFRFPVDMLRYDSMWPRTEGDSNKIQATWEPGGADRLQTVELLTDDVNAPNVDRWRSYCWQVFKVEKVR